MNLYLHGMGHFHPPNVIDNAFVEALDIGTDEEWILENVGIRERRTVLPLDYIATTRNANPREGWALVSHSHGQLAAEAARMALKRAGLEPSDLCMVISGSSSDQWSSPSESSAVAGELGIDVPAFDVSSACTTFAGQLHFLGMVIPEAIRGFVLVVVPETTTPCLDFNNREHAVLFGDAAAAAVLSVDVPSRARITATRFEGNPTDWRRVIMRVGGHFEQDGKVLQKYGVKRAVATFRQLSAERDSDARPPFFIAQQSSLSLMESACMLLKLEDWQHLYNADRFGSCGAAGAPTVLSQRWEDFGDGDGVILTQAGAGLSAAGVVVEFRA